MGFLVHTPPKVKFAEQDLFNLWDHVAIDPTTQEVFWIQTKSRMFTEVALPHHAAFPAPNKWLFAWVESARTTQGKVFQLLIRRF